MVDSCEKMLLLLLLLLLVSIISTTLRHCGKDMQLVAGYYEMYPMASILHRYLPYLGER
jgi:hypothetical protein